MVRSTVFLILAFVCISATGNSQILISLLFGDKLNSDKIEFGLDGGLVLSQLSGPTEAEFKPGIHLGFYFDFFLSEKMDLHTGVIVKSPMGAKGFTPYSLESASLDSLFSGGEVARKLRYFNVPVSLKYRFYDQLFIEVGGMIGLKSKCSDVFSNTVLESDDLELRRNIKPLISTIDAGILFGLGYQLMDGKGMNIGVRYYAGLTDTLKDNPGDAFRNGSLYVFVGIPIGAGKAPGSE